MTWKYDKTLATTKDKVRLAIGDTLVNQQLFSDEEVDQFLLDRGDDVYSTASELARSLASRFARQASISAGEIRISRKEQSEQYLALADRLASRSRRTAIPVVTNDTTEVPYFDRKTHLPDV